MSIFLLGTSAAPAFGATKNSDLKLTASAINLNDPFYTTDDSDIDSQWYLPKTKVPEAWNFSTGQSTVIVAVVDTGIHASHVELDDGRVIAGYNAITGEEIPAGANSDDNGHGTAVAGVIGAIPNNKKGVAGINWHVELMPIKVLDKDGSGVSSVVAKGITWAADHGANIINLSMGSTGFKSDRSLSSAVAYAFNKGVLLVAAAGNDTAEHGLNLDASPIYPVCSDNGANMVLGVAATDINDQKADFSDFGSNCVDIAAPGKKILTAAFFPDRPSNNILVYGSGTSLAAPIVAGIAALFKASNPNLSNVEIRNLIMTTADNVDAKNSTNCGGVSCAGLLGAGRVNAYTYFSPKVIAEGSLLRDPLSDTVYIISNTIKHAVYPLVFSEKNFNPKNVQIDGSNQLDSYVLGLPLFPPDGTLIKTAEDPTVYIIDKQRRRPVSAAVFKFRGFRFSNIHTITNAEMQAYPAGSWLPLPDGTPFLKEGEPTVYLMDQEVKRPISYFVFTQRHLSFANILKLGLADFSNIPTAKDNYWMPPLDGTLVKSSADPTIYLIEAGQRHPLTAATFALRNYSLSKVKILPPAEINIIAPGVFY
ncbi:MAG TPA: S8 family serine peptidase [Methylomirabilota bacterium]|nr:S8 family serine peptidase [Methylomirabilota bacterium]